MASRTLHSIRGLQTSPARLGLVPSLRGCQQPRFLRQSLFLGRDSSYPSRMQIRVFARYQSSTSQAQKNAPSSSGPRQTPPSVGAILRKGLDFSTLFSLAGKDGFRRLLRQSPGEFILALIALAGVTGVALYTVYLYFFYFYDTQFTRFPPDVAKSLRRALYYTNIKPDPKLAHKYYMRSLEQCNQNQLDPFSDDVLGIRIQVAAWLEKIGNFDGAITVLNGIAKDCLRWVETMEKGIAEGTVPLSGKIPVPKPDPAEQRAGEAPGAQGEEILPENLWRKRTRLLTKAVGTNVKLGELNASEYVMEPEESQARLTWAVETALKELKRRHDEGVKEDEGPWMSAAEIGGALEALARSYESRSQFQLALPLYFHALRLCESPCHRAVLMNNLAASFAQHPPHLPVTTLPGETPDPSQTSPLRIVGREQHLESALNWASNAHAHAADVKGDDRTPECDEACAVSLCNLGDISLMLGKKLEARRHFENCIAMSKEMGFTDGVKQAQAGLDRVKAQP
ncbi:uncharacterized protein DNG_00805 [Cephalotrichum gorgonifer]|uniref:TPR domain-containing protein n=1 Tax=Cephalotrichum gorgonifer TaxID=2041049 RepID=A0AAE8MQY5_9PEZI|nr:uncharacterized protein DNG_00805 [Cephalotrichum gorgonifer]